MNNSINDKFPDTPFTMERAKSYMNNITEFNT